MKIWGILFIVFGGFWTLAGFATYASDIQLGIAVSGVNMIGLGLVLVFMSGLQNDLEDLRIVIFKNFQKSSDEVQG